MNFIKKLFVRAPDAETLFNQGIAYANEGKLDHAAVSFRKATDLDPAYTVVSPNGREIYALADFNREINTNPRNPLAWGARGEAYISIGDYDRAISDFNEATRLHLEVFTSSAKSGHRGIRNLGLAVEELNSGMAASAFGRGIAHQHKGEYDQSISNFSSAVTLNPQYGEAYYNRGVAYLSKADSRQNATPVLRIVGIELADEGAYDKAIADFDVALRLIPNDCETYCARGKAYASKLDYIQAIADYSTALWSDPYFVDAYLSRADAYSVLLEYDRAISDYSEVVKLDPDRVMAYQFRGDAFARQGDYDSAIADYTHVLRSVASYKDASSHPNLSSIVQFTQRVTDATQAINLDPNDAYAYHSRGGAYRVFRSLEARDLAIANYTRSIELNPDSSDIDRECLSSSFQSRGKALLSLGYKEQSDADFDMANRLAGISTDYID